MDVKYPIVKVEKIQNNEKNLCLSEITKKKKR